MNLNRRFDLRDLEPEPPTLAPVAVIIAGLIVIAATVIRIFK